MRRVRFDCGLTLNVPQCWTVWTFHGRRYQFYKGKARRC